MHRRQFLGAAAALTGLSSTRSVGAATAGDEPAVQECDICGEPKPTAMIDRTTVPAIAPLEANICAVCQLVQRHSLPDDVCMECGSDLNVGYSIEIEFPVGTAALPGNKAGRLCGDCAVWHVDQINYGGLQADEDARERMCELIDEETERLDELEVNR